MSDVNKEICKKGSLNSSLGFTFQQEVCNKYELIPCEHAQSQFSAAYDSKLKAPFSYIIDEIFSKLELYPVKCTTFMKNNHEELIPYNFVLNDGSTLSIRTNIDKKGLVSPRIVGQAGFEKLNDYFQDIYGEEIKNKTDIKKLFIYHIDEVMPTYIDFLFDATYVIWLYYDNDGFKYYLIKGDSVVNITYDKKLFSFTQTLDSWNVSMVVKYKNISLANVEILKDRSLIFRFYMNKILPMLLEKAANNETIGISAEKTICDKYSLDRPASFNNRSSIIYENKLRPVIDKAFIYLPKAIKHTGSMSGERKGNSKCSYDFILAGNKTLSLKTNIGKKVCPPEVGQPGPETCYLYFKDYCDSDHIDNVIFKKMVFNHIQEMLPIYINHMFDSDYLLWLYEEKNQFNFKILDASFAKGVKFDTNKFSFTKSTIEDWNVSSTLKYDGISIGEFEVHTTREVFEFRFIFSNFIALIDNMKRSN